MAHSETTAWRATLEYASSILASATNARTRNAAQSIMEIAADMLDQVAEGVHRNPSRKKFKANPALVIWPNPPHDLSLGRKFGSEVYDIRYKHVDGENYEHPFEPGVELWKARIGGHDGVIIIGAHGQPITGEF